QRGRKKERKEAPPRVVLTMSQMGKGTLRRTWELSEVTEGTPAHHRMENSQGSFTVYRFTLSVAPRCWIWGEWRELCQTRTAATFDWAPRGFKKHSGDSSCFGDSLGGIDGRLGLINWVR
uniref:Uncharacterized protein n=1 Tax=Cyanistes caeruleus TaxID=156563 RepID=A0A8C0U6J5_CYACU